MNRRMTCVALLALSASILTGCSSQNVAPVGTPSPSSTRSATPSATSSPSATPEPSSSPTVTATPSAKPSETPSTKPAPQPTVKPQPKPEPVKTVVLELGADELRIEDAAGTVKESFPYEGDSTDEAIAALTSVYGKEPKTLYTGNEICNYQNNVYSWDNISLVFQAESQTVADAERFRVLSSDPNLSYERIVQAPNGAQVGLSLKRFMDASPELVRSAPNEYQGTTYGSMIGEPSKLKNESAASSGSTGLTPADANAVGTVIFSINDRIETIHAPSTLIGDC